MKRAFSLIETTFALVILGLVFAFFYQSTARVAKNHSFFALNQAIYDEQRALQNAPTQEIQIFVENLGNLQLLQSIDEASRLKFRGLKPIDEGYKAYFVDEKSF